MALIAVTLDRSDEELPIAEFLMKVAAVLDEWSRQSRTGGWSTHQTDANQEVAAACRRKAVALMSYGRQ